jgi:hypothetical protein
VDTALGLLGLTVFVVCVIGLAAGVTWLVVKIDGWVRRLRHRPAPSAET